MDDLSTEEMVAVLELAAELRRCCEAREPHAPRPGRMLGMVFEKASTRTRAPSRSGCWSSAATRSTCAQGRSSGAASHPRHGAVLSALLHAIMVRTFAQADTDELARTRPSP